MTTPVPLPPHLDAEASALLEASFVDYPIYLYMMPDLQLRARFVQFLFERWIPLVRGVDGSQLHCVLGPAEELLAVSLVLPPDLTSTSPGIGFREPSLMAQLLAGLAELPFRYLITPGHRISLHPRA